MVLCRLYEQVHHSLNFFRSDRARARPWGLKWEQPETAIYHCGNCRHVATSQYSILTTGTPRSGPVCGNLNSPASLAEGSASVSKIRQGISSRCFWLHCFRFALCELFQSLLSILRIKYRLAREGIANIATRWVLDLRLSSFGFGLPTGDYVGSSFCRCCHH